jgi:hypothetical protein
MYLALYIPTTDQSCLSSLISSETCPNKKTLTLPTLLGFNRTGFFIVCYLVERLGYDVQSAIDEFAKQRPNGIKHAHFIDELFVRYCKGLKRAPTI